MFATLLTRWTASLARAAAWAKAFALLEDPPRGATAGATVPELVDAAPCIADRPAAGIAASVARTRTHPHARRAPVPERARRAGAVSARPAPCTMPLTHRVGAPRATPLHNARWAAQRAAHR